MESRRGLEKQISGLYEFIINKMFKSIQEFKINIFCNSFYKLMIPIDRKSKLVIEAIFKYWAFSLLAERTKINFNTFSTNENSSPFFMRFEIFNSSYWSKIFLILRVSISCFRNIPEIMQNHKLSLSKVINCIDEKVKLK